jgi:hypothetical protein
VKVSPRAALAAAALACVPLTLAATDPDADIDVKVTRAGDTLVIDVGARVPVSQQEAWDVLTDFDHMATIVSNLESSRVLERSDGRVVVAQKGGRNEGVLRFAFETVREVELRPYSYMRAHLLSGTVERLDGTTTLTPRNDGTFIASHGDCVTGTWVPPLVGEIFLRNATREQYADLRREMIRRHAEGR